MSFRIAESWLAYPTGGSVADTDALWLNAMNIGSGSAPYGGNWQYLRVSGSNVSSTWTQSWNANDTTIYGEIWMLSNGGWTGSGNANGVQFADGSTPQVCFWWDCDGNFYVSRGGIGGTTLGSTQLSIGVWHSIEFKIVIGASGSVTLRHNGSPNPFMTLTGVNTQQSANSYVNALQVSGTDFGTRNGNATGPIFVCSGDATSPNTWTGQLKPIALVPTALSGSAFFTASPGGDTNVQAVSELPPNGDTSYVTASSVGEEQYTLTQLGQGFNIVGVQPYVSWRKSDTGARTVQLSVAANGSADTPEITRSDLGTNYVTEQMAMGADPTGAPWTVTSVNSLTIGLSITA